MSRATLKNNQHGTKKLNNSDNDGACQVYNNMTILL